MSLYIGKDMSNTNVLHVTHGTNTKAELASGQLNNTVFHSDLKYLTCDRYTGGSFYIKNIGYNAPNGMYIGNASAGNYIYITPPSEFLARINGTQTAYVIVINGYAIHHSIVNLPGLFTWGATESGVWNADGFFPSPANPMTCTRQYSTYENPVIEFYVLNFVNGAYIRPAKSSNSISISTEEGIIIGGINISEVNFLANTVTNPIDFKFMARAFSDTYDSFYVQVLNSYNNTNKPITITSSANSTKLLTADYTILDSSQGDINYSYTETITTIINAIPISSSIDILEQIGSGFNDDDIFAMSLFFEGWYSSFISSYLTVFKYKRNEFITGVPISESFVYNGYRAYIYLVGGSNGELYLRTILNYYGGSGLYKKRTINVYKFS